MSKRFLYLYSGKKDSVENLICYLKSNQEVKVDLLYIKNIGFRNISSIPISSAFCVSEYFCNVENLIVLDGSRVQLELVKSFSCEFGVNMKAFLFCVMCQFEINYMYSKFIIEKCYSPIIINTEIFGEVYYDVLNMPFDHFKVPRVTYPKMSFDNDNAYRDIIKNILKHDNGPNQCQLSYFHRINHFPTCDINKVKEILIDFIGKFNFNKLQFKIYNLNKKKGWM